MTDKLADAKSLQSKANKIQWIYRILGVFTTISLLALLGNFVFNSPVPWVPLTVVTILSSVGGIITKSRYSDAITTFENTCAQKANRNIAKAETALEEGSLDEAESVLNESIRLCELAAADNPWSLEDQRQNQEVTGENVNSNLLLPHSVAATYLDLLNRHRGSRYDLSLLDSKLPGIVHTTESGAHEKAVELLTDVAETLADNALVIESIRQPAGYDGVDKLSSTQKRQLREAGYNSPVFIANLSVETVADTLDTDRGEAEAIHAACQSRIGDDAYVGQFVENETTIDGYRDQWNDAAAHVRDGILKKTTQTLEHGVTDLPDWSDVGPDTVTILHEPIEKIRTQLNESVKPIVSLRSSVSSCPWVTLDLSVVAPIEPLQPHSQAESSQLVGHTLAIALADLETIEREFAVRLKDAEEARKTALNHLTEAKPQYEQLVTAVSKIAEYQQACEHAKAWNEFRDAVQETEDALERATQVHQTSGADAADAIETARDQISHLEELLDSTPFPAPVYTECKQHYEDLSAQLTEIRTTVEERQQNFLAEAEALLEQAEQEAETGHLETANATLREAEDTFRAVSSILDSTEVSTIEDELRRVDHKITIPLFEDRIAEFEAKARTISNDIETDLSAAKQRLSAVESDLDDLQSEIGREVQNQSQTQELLQDLTEVREFVADVYQQIEKQAAEAALSNAWDAINQAGVLAESGDVQQAQAELQTADSRLSEATQALDESKLTEARTAIKQVEDQITAACMDQAIEDLESNLQLLAEESNADIESREDELATIEARVDLLWQEFQAELTTLAKRRELRQRIADLNHKIADIEHQLVVERESQLIKEANDRLEGASSAIEANELRVAPTKIEAAKNTVQGVEVSELEPEIDAFDEEITAVRAQLQEAYIRHALGETTHELDRAKGYLQHDIADTRDRIHAARTHLKAAEHLIFTHTLPASSDEELQEQINRRYSEVKTLRDRCLEREITEAIEDTTQTIKSAETALQAGEINDAQSIAHNAESRLESIPDEVPASRVGEIRNDIESIQTAIAQYEIGEHITNAEATVDQAEAGRAAGEVVDAINAYQRAISTYEAAQLEAKNHSTPETYEIDVRIKQLTAEIESVKDQWADTRIQHIDRELRAGERAVAQGIDAVREGDLDTAETKYDSADDAADAAQTLLNNNPNDPTGGELKLPSNLNSEYQSAYNSLVGHLGYLRTRIQESKDSDTSADTRATPLSEYYDGFYTVYRSLPSDAHPIWKEALTAVLFGGEGLAAGTNGYGTQQANRTETAISTLREENGNGKRITEFTCIETASPRAEDQEFVPSQQPLPVAPESGIVLPVDVDLNVISDAIDLLSEFPALPEAGDSKRDLDSIIKVSYFEDRIDEKTREVTDVSNTVSDETDGKSEELGNILNEIEQEINEFKDSV